MRTVQLLTTFFEEETNRIRPIHTWTEQQADRYLDALGYGRPALNELTNRGAQALPMQVPFRGIPLTYMSKPTTLILPAAARTTFLTIEVEAYNRLVGDSRAINSRAFGPRHDELESPECNYPAQEINPYGVEPTITSQRYPSHRLRGSVS